MTKSKLLGLLSGFRSGRSTTEQIMTLRFLLHAARAQRCSLTIVFVDHGKTFYLVDRRAIPVVLRLYGVPDPVVTDVMQLYHGSTATVSTRFGLTESFDTTSGVLQGDTLSPHLLILLIDYIFRQSLIDEDGFTLNPANVRRYPAVTLTALAYTDDVAITIDSASGVERHYAGSSFIQRRLNAARTEVLHVG